MSKKKKKSRVGTPRDTTKPRAAAVKALRDPLGRDSKPLRVLAVPETHEWLGGLSAAERGDLFTALRELQERRGGGVAALLAALKDAGGSAAQESPDNGS